MTKQEAIEQMKAGYVLTAKESFETLWVKINGRERWDVNPWVWRVGFERFLI